ncbi:MAG: hypothetical protein LBM76_01935 [Mycoplasmataceae bacterium]|nr:hypothetical protein [Mycoplasmataceae bacterium]
MKRKFNKKLLLLLVPATVAPLIVTSCNSISSDILNNLVGTGDGTKFGDYTLAGDSDAGTLKSEVKQALTDSSSNGAFKTQVVNKLISKWYDYVKTNADGAHKKIYQDRWDGWVKAAKSDYDSKVSDYKSQHGDNWPYYFQNEVLDPVGGTKAAYLQDSEYSALRSFFTGEIFKTSYLGMRKDHTTPANYSSYGTWKNSAIGGLNDPIDVYTQGQLESTPIMEDNLSSAIVNKWESIDFYGSTASSTSPKNSFDKERDSDYASIQHYTFEKMLEATHSVSTSMTLWKYTTPAAGMDSVYKQTPDGTIKPSDSADYMFPFFDNSTLYNTNTKYYDMVTDNSGYNTHGGFFASNSTSVAPTYKLNPFGAYNPGGAAITGAIEINKNYTDDSSTLFKVNLGTDAYTGLNQTYAASVAELWNTFTSGTTSDYFIRNSYPDTTDQKAQTMGYAKLNPKTLGGTAGGVNADIMNNFLYTNTKSATPDANPISNITNPNTFDLTNIYNPNRLTTNIKLDIFNDGTLKQWPADSVNWYTNGYCEEVPSYQIANSAGTQGLPYIIIREEPGVHIIGLDCAGYLTSPITEFINTPVSSQARENVILKARCLQELANQAQNYTGGTSTSPSFNFCNASGELSSYFTNNTNDILLTIADEAINAGSAITGNVFYNIFHDTDELISADSWNKMYNLFNALNAITLYNSAISNWNSSNKKMFDFSSAYTANGAYGYNNSPATKTYEYYKSGLATQLGFALISGDKTLSEYADDTSWQVDTYGNPTIATNYICTKSIIDNAFSTIKNSLGVSAFDATNRSIATLNSYYDSTFNSFYTTSVQPDLDKSGSKYLSEHILVKNGTNSEYDGLKDAVTSGVNYALNSFGSSNNFSNKVKLDAYKSYIGDSYTQELNDGTMKKAIASQYLSSKLLSSSDTSLNSYAQNVTSADELTTILQDQYDYANLTKGDVANSYSSDQLNYLQYQATLKYVKDGNYANFLSWLGKKIKVDQSAYIAWVSKNDTLYSTDFNNPIGDGGADTITTANVYGIHAGYENLNDTTYTTGTVGPTPDQFIKASDSNYNYYSFADMSKLGGYYEGLDGFGFQGLITSTTNSLSSTASDALFGSGINKGWAYSNPTSNATGALYSFGAIGNSDDFAWGAKYPGAAQANENTLMYRLGVAAKNDDTNSILNINSNIKTNLGDNWTDASLLITQHNSIADDTLPMSSTERAAIIAAIILGYHKENNDGNIAVLDSYLGNAWTYGDFGAQYGITSIDLTTYTTQAKGELKNPNNPNLNVILDSADANRGIGSRVAVQQISYDDVHGSSWEELTTKFGVSVMDNLLIQCAMDSGQQNDATNVVRLAFAEGGRIAVYDRRYNDQLGSMWVKNWKYKN